MSYFVKHTLNVATARAADGNRAVVRRAAGTEYIIDGLSMSYDEAARYLCEDGMQPIEAHRYLSRMRKAVCY